ncbi:GIY-YIG nuclease family protein [Alloacidobacterium dinghuense]|uniref:GIY-YIG nuclease family protein n=1 Tax=Alloacidobacterium dinghuense TaxID=2763107 RepID=UPI0020372609|nr:GIY-YIG nuclease family protein [Alloacidobacterium dinghuense]
MIEKAWVYILASDRGVLYIGVTSNLYKRVLDHRSGIRSGIRNEIQMPQADLFRRIRVHNFSHSAGERTQRLEKIEKNRSHSANK